MGVQIRFEYPENLDFKPFSEKSTDIAVADE
jgi:hypothetical protein